MRNHFGSDHSCILDAATSTNTPQHPSQAWLCLSLAWAWAKPEDNWSLLGRKDIGERVLSVGANLSVDVKVDGTKV